MNSQETEEDDGVSNFPIDIKVEITHEAISTIVTRHQDTPVSDNTSRASPQSTQLTSSQPSRTLFRSEVAIASPTSPRIAATTIFNNGEESQDLLFSNGYDSDGEKAPPIIGESPDAYEETTLPSYATIGEEAQAINSENILPDQEENREIIIITNSDIKKLKNDRLRDELRKRGLSPRGLKIELLDRLVKAMADRVPIARVHQEEAAQHTVFADGVKWTVMRATNRVEDPLSIRPPTLPSVEDRSSIRPPTLPVGEVEASKFDFLETFDRPPFVGEVERPVLNRFKRIKVDRNGKCLTQAEVRERGRVNPAFVQKNKLSATSHPSDWFGSFLPTKLTNDWTSYTNTKAMMANAGQPGQPYADFKPFTCKELRQHIGVYILQGIAPSPRINMKFHRQSDNCANGNDFITRSLGPNATRRHLHFKRFLGVQDPLKMPPSKKKCPLWKVQKLLDWMNTISKDGWLLGKFISIDEQTIGFQGRHSDKLRITYKAEGDGFQCDAVCDEGFTYAFYFRNEPPPEKYDYLSALHARVMSLFDTLQEKNHRVNCDNLYISARLCREAFKHPKQVLVQGVCRVSGRGFPEFAKQHEIKDKTELERARGTVKGARLTGDPLCPDLVAVSVYDTKPVHFLSMTCDEVKWIRKTRKVFDKAKKKMVKGDFLRLNINDEYNNGMGGVDIADQLRGYYRFDKWQRTFKWWHSVFWWSFQVLMVNSYKCYQSHIIDDLHSNPMSHYEFQKMIAEAWIDPDCLNKKIKSEDETTDVMSVSSTITGSSTVGTAGNRVRFCSSSLDPLTGSLRCRIDHSGVGHWPIKAKNNEYCQLHRWANPGSTSNSRKRKYKGVIRCSECNVTLCVGYCYETFHEVWNLQGKKHEIQQIFSENFDNDD